MAGDEAPAKKSDLGVRVASAVVMLAIAGTALWLGGWWLKSFIVAVALAACFEMARLIFRATGERNLRLVGILGGAVYIGVAALVMLEHSGMAFVRLLTAVIGVDVGAYFVGRAFGGPKIAPSISPSKTWSGLVGGGFGAAFTLFGLPSLFYNTSLCRWYYGPPQGFDHRCDVLPGVSNLGDALLALAIGLAIAIVAQAGDFLESWLKRKAGMKDSSNLIPGHGGVLDRVDGLIALAFVAGVVAYVLRIWQ